MLSRKKKTYRNAGKKEKENDHGLNVIGSTMPLESQFFKKKYNKEICHLHMFLVLTYIYC